VDGATMRADVAGVLRVPAQANAQVSDHLEHHHVGHGVDDIVLDLAA
jgi:hypothetical protein